MPRRKATAVAEIIPIGGPSPGGVPTDGADEAIQFLEPYRAEVTIEFTRDFLFHGWNVEAVAEKAAAAKGSRAKKTDNLESYIYRDADGYLGIPGTYLHGALKQIGKYKQDPRSPRKSQHDLMCEAIVMETEIARLTPAVRKWDFEHKGRVIVQRQAITRTWPAIKRGAQVTFALEVILPEYIPPEYLNEIIALAGRIKGMGDYRPTYGRFQITSFRV